MAKFRVSQEAEYVIGHLRYGHREGIIEADSLEDAERKIKEEGYTDYLDFVLDDYSCEGVSYEGNKFEYEEIMEDVE